MAKVKRRSDQASEKCISVRQENYPAKVFTYDDMVHASFNWQAIIIIYIENMFTHE